MSRPDHKSMGEFLVGSFATWDDAQEWLLDDPYIDHDTLQILKRLWALEKFRQSELAAQGGVR